MKAARKTVACSSPSPSLEREKKTMWYLIQQYAFWLLAALVIGLVIGWLTFAPRKTSWWGGWVPVAAIAFVAGVLLAITRMIPGVPGLWLDTALLFFTTYIAGCFLGSWLRGLLGVRETAPQMAYAGPAPVAPPAPERTVVAAVRPVPVEKAPVEREKTIVAPARKVATPAVAASAVVMPEAAPRIEGEEKIAGQRPAGLMSPRGGKADDLKLIKGIGKQNEGRLHGLGIWHFDQISAWSKQNVLWAGSYLAFPGRIEREEWVTQARQLAAGKETEFSKRAKWGLVATSKDDGSLGLTNIEDVKNKRKP
jgi:predicted flap endonuclease-1-like 5' DNA nuclease